MNATGESDLQNYYDYVNSQREAKLRPVLERLLPIMAVSAWGAVPDNLQIDFPPLWTPTAKEVAEIAKGKAEAIISTYQAGLLNVAPPKKNSRSLPEKPECLTALPMRRFRATPGKRFRTPPRCETHWWGWDMGRRKQPALLREAPRTRRFGTIHPASRGIRAAGGRAAAEKVK